MKKSARNKNYWLERGHSEEDSIQLARSRMPGTIEYYTIFKGKSVEEAALLSTNYQRNRSNTLENFIRKHGIEDGTRRFNIYRDKQAYSNTLEYMVKKYGTENGTSKYFSANKNRAITLENCIKKHGKVGGSNIFNAYVKKRRIVGKTKEYFIEKYGEEIGEEMYANIGKRKSMTFNGFLLRANGNIEEATIAFNEYTKRRFESSIRNRGVSESSQKFFDLLRDALLSLGYKNFYYATHNCEWGFNIVSKNRFVYLDFFLKDTGRVIEYNGDYFHANPKSHRPDDIVHIYGEPQKSSDIWKKDEDRITAIKTIPYIKDVLTIWESECKIDTELTLKRCLQFLIQ